MAYERADRRRLERYLVAHRGEHPARQVQPGEEITCLGHGRASAHGLQRQAHLVSYRNQPAADDLSKNRIGSVTPRWRSHCWPIFTWIAPRVSVAAVPPGGTTTTHPGSWIKHGPATNWSALGQSHP